MRAWIAAVLVFASMAGTAPAATAWSTRIGVAVQKDGGVCLSIRNSSLKPGDRLSLIDTSKPESTIDAEVVAKAGSACPGITDHAESGYQLKINRGQAPDFLPLIAVAGGRVAPKQKFRSCTSAEGVHLTMWQGKPLHSPRLWHEYYYLGMDVEANCTAKDTAR